MKREEVVTSGSYLLLLVLVVSLSGYYLIVLLSLSYILGLFLLFFILPIAILVAGLMLIPYFARRGLEFHAVEDYTEIQKMMSKNCKRLAIKDIPELLIAHSEKPNCFIYGFRSKGAKLVVTTGCINLLDKDELNSAILHELAHIKNKDVGFLMLTTLLTKAFWYPILMFVLMFVFIFVYFGVDLLTMYTFAELASTFCCLFLGLVVFPFTFIKYVYRYREFLADARVSTCLGDSSHLVSAITKVSKYLYIYSCLEEKFRKHSNIVNVLRKTQSFFGRFAHSSPKLIERLEAIEKEEYIAKKGGIYIPSLRESILTGVACIYLRFLLILYGTWIFSYITWKTQTLHWWPLGSPILLPVWFLELTPISLGSYLVFRNSDFSTLTIRDCLRLATKIFIGVISFSGLFFITKDILYFVLSGLWEEVYQGFEYVIISNFPAVLNVLIALLVPTLVSLVFVVTYAILEKMHKFIVGKIHIH